MKKKFQLPSTAHNWLTAAGAVISLSAITVFLFLLFATLISNQSSSYLGLIMFIIIPPFIIIGLILIPVGMYRTHKKMQRGERDKSESLKFDFSKTSHRNAAIIFTFGTLFFVLLTALGSYETFHFTESNTFCGEVCHSVMKPEYTAYQKSPHARVHCVECHVGEGVDWYVKSKLSGLRQVYGVITGDFNRPIETPIRNLRPARETCEKCHWPEKFYARTDRLEIHYLSDEENTPWNIYLTLKIGGEHNSQGLAQGIHWHINKNIEIQYAASDKRRQEIPWVRYINKATNDTTEFIDSEADFELAMLDTMEIRTMDCIDCHNRPSHQYLPPDKFIDYELSKGTISTDIPEIKAKLLEICEEDFPSIDSLAKYTKENLTEFYSSDYEDFYDVNENKILSSIDAFVETYSKNIFPSMKVKWSAYPSNIGHLFDTGCFRCHNNNHESDDGKLIKKDCVQCHIINAQGTPDNLVRAEYGKGLEFQHPVDIDGEWRETNCNECHTGLLP